MLTLTYSELESIYCRISKKAERLLDHMKRGVKTPPEEIWLSSELTVHEAAKFLLKIETEVTRRSKLN